MPATKNTTASLHATLLKGLDVKSRSDGSVHTIKNAAGAVVAECCVGKRATRINFRQLPAKLPKGLTLEGRSKSWAGGGTVVTEANVAALRTLLASVASTPAKKDKAKAPAAKKTPPAPAAPKPVLATGDTDDASRSTAPSASAAATAI